MVSSQEDVKVVKVRVRDKYADGRAKYNIILEAYTANQKIVLAHFNRLLFWHY